MRRFLAFAIFLCAVVLPGRAERVLVVPFRNLSEAPNLEWIGESISENIREGLAVQQRETVSRDEREEAARGLSLGIPSRLSMAALLKLGAELEASHLVLGEFEAAESTGPPAAEAPLRITARIIELERLANAAQIEERGLMTDLGQIQSRLAWKVLCQILDGACPAEDEFLASCPPVRLDAVENYVRGLLSSAPEQKHRHFAQAALLAPDFAAPRFELGKMHWGEGAHRAAVRWLEQVAATDSRYLEATFLLGLARYHMGDYHGAADAFYRVAKIAPSAPVWNNLGVALLRLGDPGALETLQHAVESDPADPNYHFNAGYILWRQGDLAGAAERFHGALTLDPDDADAQQMLERCRQNSGPRRGDLSSEGLERLKEHPGRIPRSPGSASQHQISQAAP